MTFFERKPVCEDPVHEVRVIGDDVLQGVREVGHHDDVRCKSQYLYENDNVQMSDLPYSAIAKPLQRQRYVLIKAPKCYSGLSFHQVSASTKKNIQFKKYLN